VTKTGEPVLLRPMNSKERWVIHNVVNETAGLRSESVGEGRMRRVKIEPE
jgi:predicted RNA-binding protein Jag